MRNPLSCLLFALLLFPAAAHADAWEAKTMRAPYSTREIERPLLLSKGWLEFGLGADVKLATGYWGSDGSKQDFENAHWLYTTERLDIRYGVAPRAELYWRVPVHYLQLTNDALGTDTSGVYWGDPKFGWRFEAFHSDAPLTSVATVVELKVPLGNEAPGSFISGPSSFQRFVTTTGTPDLRLGVDAKRQFGPVAIGGSLGYVYRFSGLVQYAMETNTFQFLGRIKPGQQVYGDLKLLAQLGPVALHVEPGVEAHGPVLLGTTSPGVLPDKNLEPVEGSDGWSLDVDTGATLNLGHNFDIVYSANVPIRGEDLMFFPIEDIHPTRGVTHSATIKFRY